MVRRHTRDHITWVDLEAATPEELRTVIEEFGIDAEIEEEILAPTPYPLVATYPDYVFLVLHFPTANLEGGARVQEIDIVAGKDFLITARYELVGSIASLHKAFDAEEMLGTETVTKLEAGALIERVFRRLYGAMGEEVEATARKLETIERDIFSGKEAATVRQISEVGRVLLRFDTTLSRHQEPLDTFLTTLTGTSFLGKGFAKRAARIEAERSHVAGVVKAFREVTKELRITNDSLLSSSQEGVMKTFTAITVILLPLSLITELFGMHVKYPPILKHPFDFWIIVALLFVVGIVITLYLRKKKWM